MGRFHKFWLLPRREKLFLCEACILLLLANLSVKIFAFGRIERHLRAHCNNDRVLGISASACDLKESIKLVDLSVARAAVVLPFKSLCLSRSIATFIMLRRRGFPAVLFAGVRVCADSSLIAHAWVEPGCGMMERSSEKSAFTTLVRIGLEP
jgi:Transglutaminase-like superfamily